MSKLSESTRSRTDALDLSEDSPLSSPRHQSGTNRPRVRISHACDRCRALRARCTGQKRCDRCVKDGTPCFYSDRKRERVKKEFSESNNRIDGLLEEKTMLIAALKEVSQSPNFNTSRHPDVLKMLERIEQASEDEVADSRPRPRNTRQGSSGAGSSIAIADDTSSTGERRVLADMGSPGRRGEIRGVVHLHTGSGLAGYIGKMSEISWIQRVHDHVEGKSLTFVFEMPSAQMDHSAERTEDMSYFVDEDDLLSVDEDFVNPYQYPVVSTAMILSEAFFHALHGSFYFVEREKFLNDLMTVQAAGPISTWSQRMFLAVCNLVWATAARWLQLTQIGQRTDAEDHLVYYARARSLGLDHRIQFDHADVQTVQGLGILAFYLMINCSIQRAYLVLGQAIRHAIALGLHLKVSNGTVVAVENEKRRKIWNSLYRLEVLLSAMTGRPKCVSFTDVTVPSDVFQPTRSKPGDVARESDKPSSWMDAHSLWLDFLGADRLVAATFIGGVVDWTAFTSIGMGSSQTHFLASLQLSHINDEVGTRLYSAGLEQTWFDVQNTIRDLEAQMRAWSQNLPQELRPDYPGWSDFDARSRLELATSFHSLGMMLYRPCLCEPKIDDESLQSYKFNQDCARYCVEAALHMISLMPDTPVAHQVLQVLPWWTLLHYTTQAAGVLLLELCLNMQHVQGTAEVVMLALRKALSYLLSLSGTSKSALKAWNTLHPLFGKALQQYTGPALS